MLDIVIEDIVIEDIVMLDIVIEDIVMLDGRKYKYFLKLFSDRSREGC